MTLGSTLEVPISLGIILDNETFISDETWMSIEESEGILTRTLSLPREGQNN